MTEIFDNVWDAIIDDPAERESCKIKSELMIAVEQYIGEQGITQQQAAKLMGVTQPKISNIVNGNIDRITIDMLVNMLAKVGVRVSMEVGDKKKRIEKAHVVRFVNTISQDAVNYRPAVTSSTAYHEMLDIIDGQIFAPVRVADARVTSYQNSSQVIQ